jgi:hypothetical protein
MSEYGAGPVRSIHGVEALDGEGNATPVAGDAYAVDIDAAGEGWVRLLRRGDGPPFGDRPSLVITVQPGRSFGRYRHRAWPLWIADAAYALEAVRALVPAAVLPDGWDLMGEARRLAGLPHGHDAESWVRHGLAPEICLARIGLPGGWRDPARKHRGERLFER